MFNVWIALSHFWLAFICLLVTGETIGKGNVMIMCCLTAYFTGMVVWSSFRAWEDK